MNTVLAQFLSDYRAAFGSSLDSLHLQKLLKETLMTRANLYIDEHLLNRSTTDLLAILAILVTPPESSSAPKPKGKICKCGKQKETNSALN